MSRYSAHLDNCVAQIDSTASSEIDRATYHAHTQAANTALALLRSTLGRRGDLHGWQVQAYTHCGDTYLVLRDPGLFHPPAARRLSEFEDHFSGTTQELLDWAEETLGKPWAHLLSGFFLVSPDKSDLAKKPTLY